MNKLETLRDYSFRRIRDTWAALGSQTCDSSTRFYSKDNIYLLNEPTSALNGCMFFVKQELGGQIDWTQGTLADYDYGEITFTNGIISPNFVLLLLADEVASVTEPIDTSWIPFSVEVVSSSQVEIPEDEYNLLLSKALGVGSIIQEDELEYNYDQITSMMIRPALEEYFKWFPKVDIQNIPLRTSSMTEYEFPTGAYGVVHIQVNQGTGSGGPSNILLRYFDEVAWGGTNGNSIMGVGGRAAPRRQTFDYGSMMLDRASRQGMINYATRIHHHTVVRNGKRYLQVSSNKQGYLQIHWAYESLNWLDVERPRIPELRRLCIAHIRENFGVIRSQAKSDIPGSVDYSSWEKDAQAVQKEITASWAEMTKFSGIIRGSS